MIMSPRFGEQLRLKSLEHVTIMESTCKPASLPRLLLQDGAQFVPLRHFDGFWFFGFCLVFL